VSGRLRVGVRIILGALLVRIAAATIGVGQAAREVLMSLSSDLTGPFFVLRFCGLVGLVRQWQRRIVLLNIFRPGSGATVWSITGDGVGSGLPFCEFHHMLRYTNPDHLSGDRARLARTIEAETLLHPGVSRSRVFGWRPSILDGTPLAKLSTCAGAPTSIRHSRARTER